MGTVSPINGHIDYAWPDWISVDFKLPEKNGDYLCFINVGTVGHETFVMDILDFVDGKFKSCTIDSDGLGLRCIDITKDVTHWMPLPPLPED